MSIARQIAPHLPFLRRFARSLDGSQAGGDAHVVAMLEAIVADPDSFPKDLPPRVGLYQVFTRMWSSTAHRQTVMTQMAGGAAPEKRLDMLTPRSRQAFLLRTVEGFELVDVAAILRITPSEVSRLIDEAGREIAAQVATSVMIIEDEPIIALDLESLVEELGHAVTGNARTHTQALELMRRRKPGLVLADIQLADGSSGLDAVNDILREIDVPVIFITAYPERLLTGDKPEPAFLITKPFQPDAVKAAISQALFFHQAAA